MKFKIIEDNVSIESINSLYAAHQKQQQEIKQHRAALTDQIIFASEGFLDIFKRKDPVKPESNRSRKELLNSFLTFFKNNKQYVKGIKTNQFYIQVKGFGNVKTSADFISAIKYQGEILNTVDGICKKEVLSLKEGVSIVRDYIKNGFTSQDEMFKTLTDYVQKRESNYAGAFSKLIQVKQNQQDILFDKYGVVKITEAANFLHKSQKSDTSITNENYQYELGVVPHCNFKYVVVNIREIEFSKDDIIKAIEAIIKLIENIISFHDDWVDNQDEYGSDDGTKWSTVIGEDTNSMYEELESKNDEFSKVMGCFAEMLTVTHDDYVLSAGRTLVDSYITMLQHFSSENNRWFK